ncbi:MAG: DUF4160 domain-containing protein [Bdellovibrionales bacterium]|nr:DUF4160 domain-containing protein [Bdellovibrionales bacterium]
MPIVSIFFGIVIRLYHGDHNPPHFHAGYGDFEAIIEIKSGKVIEGKLPPKATKLVEEWRRKNLSELNSAWAAVAALKAPKRIKGLE